MAMVSCLACSEEMWLGKLSQVQGKRRARLCKVRLLLRLLVVWLFNPRLPVATFKILSAPPLSGHPRSVGVAGILILGGICIWRRSNNRHHQYVHVEHM